MTNQEFQNAIDLTLVRQLRRILGELDGSSNIRDGKDALFKHFEQTRDAVRTWELNLQASISIRKARTEAKE